MLDVQTARQLAETGWWAACIMTSNQGRITQCEMSMLWQGQEARVAAYHGKMHGRKSVQGLAMARGEFGELTGAS